MTVVRLVPRSHADTIAVFKSLLARAMAGEIDGSGICLRTRDGDEEVFFTGLFYHRPSEAALAALRLTHAVVQAQDQDDDTRPSGRPSSRS